MDIEIMKPEMRKKIDAALARIKEPQSEVPIVDLGLVSKVNYNEGERRIRLSLAIGYPQGQCPACIAINGLVGAGIVRRAQAEFEKEFPGYDIVVE
jgi:metal-sulfur cluster biosynthetic enzyme